MFAHVVMVRFEIPHVLIDLSTHPVLPCVQKSFCPLPLNFWVNVEGTKQVDPFDISHACEFSIVEGIHEVVLLFLATGKQHSHEVASPRQPDKEMFQLDDGR